MNRSIRYIVEHLELPHEFYDAGPMLLYHTLGKPGEVISSIYNELEIAGEIPGCPYLPEEFSETHRVYVHDQDSVLVIRIEMPAPTEVRTCRAIYLCYGQFGGYHMYFTSELNSEGKFFLCGWDENYRHVNFGTAPDKPEDEMDNVSTFFWEMAKNGGADILQEIKITPDQFRELMAG